MPSWNDLLSQLQQQPNEEKGAWLNARLTQELTAVSRLRNGRNVLFYASAFLQKPSVPALFTQLTSEEINGLMSVIHGMTWTENLTLVLHTPGGQINAAETIVAYLRSKFRKIEVIVPTFAMSAGTMISLSAERIVMGRQSQLGPIDPQMMHPIQGRPVSARAIVDQFEAALEDIVPPSGNLQRAHAWAPVLQSLGPALLQEAENALEYGEKMVAGWLESGMFSGDPNAADKASAAAAHFNDATTHKSHGRRIDRQEARAQGIVVEDLEDDQELQEAVLTAYHLMTLLFEHGPAVKTFWSHHGKAWVKNLPQPPQRIQQQPTG